jgi:putative protease
MVEKGAPEEKPVGEVTHYFGHINVMAIHLTDRLAVGDRVHIVGHTTDLACTIGSMQVEHKPVAQAGPGASVGVKVTGRVRPGDHVYRA